MLRNKLVVTSTHYAYSLHSKMFISSRISICETRNLICNSILSHSYLEWHPADLLYKFIIQIMCNTCQQMDGLATQQCFTKCWVFTLISNKCIYWNSNPIGHNVSYLEIRPLWRWLNWNKDLKAGFSTPRSKPRKDPEETNLAGTHILDPQPPETMSKTTSKCSSIS